MRDPFPAWSGKNSRRTHPIQEEALSTGKARGTPASCHHSMSPPDGSVHSRGTCFPCTASTFTRRITSNHGVKLDSPVGNPRGKVSREINRSLDPRDWKRDTAATALEESARACPLREEDILPWGDSRSSQDLCQHWRGILRFRSRIHTRSLAPALKGEESREAREQFAFGLSFPEATRAGPCGARRKSRTRVATRENPGGFALQAR